MARKTKVNVEEDDVANMTHKELKERLTSLGINVGPIVGELSILVTVVVDLIYSDSTRKLYERKLAKLQSRGKEAAYSTDEDGKENKHT